MKSTGGIRIVGGVAGITTKPTSCHARLELNAAGDELTVVQLVPDGPEHHLPFHGFRQWENHPKISGWYGLIFLAAGPRRAHVLLARGAQFFQGRSGGSVRRAR